jgi:dolichol-phosphate mannosyltransferase
MDGYVHNKKYTVSVIIPCFNVTKQVINVIKGIDAEVSRIYVVDDCCPENSGDYVLENCTDERVVVLKNEQNLGVGGAVMRGYAEAIKDGATVIVKIDGDGQMDPSLINRFIRPIVEGRADYTKGNRFFYLEEIRHMPKIRIFGNAVLSFMSKLSTGYWSIFDPTNGFTAIHANVARHLPFDKISNGYFFETDMLFRLNTLKAKVVDIPMHAFYGDEKSNLKIGRVIVPFIFKHYRNFIKRLFYNYFLRDLNLASFELIFGFILMLFGSIYGVNAWINSIRTGIVTPAGTVMLAALPIILGLQLLLNFISFDMFAQPSTPIHEKLED